MGSQLVWVGVGPSKLLWGRLKARYQWFLPKGASWYPQGNSAHLLLWNEINLGVYPMKARLVLTFEDQYGSPYQQIKKEKAWDHLKTQKKTFDKVQYPLLIKALIKAGIEPSKPKKDHLRKTKSQHHRQRWEAEFFPPWSVLRDVHLDFHSIVY